MILTANQAAFALNEGGTLVEFGDTMCVCHADNGQISVSDMTSERAEYYDTPQAMAAAYALKMSYSAAH